MDPSEDGTERGECSAASHFGADLTSGARLLYGNVVGELRAGVSMCVGSPVGRRGDAFRGRRRGRGTVEIVNSSSGRGAKDRVVPSAVYLSAEGVCQPSFIQGVVRWNGVWSGRYQRTDTVCARPSSLTTTSLRRFVGASQGFLASRASEKLTGSRKVTVDYSSPTCTFFSAFAPTTMRN